MKEITITLVVACALFGAGCSPSSEKTAAATPTPVPELTAEQLAAIKNSSEANKAAEQIKRDEPTQTDVATAVIPAEVPLTAEIQDAASKPTPTPSAAPSP